MKNYTAIRERYLRDSLPVQLGGLAANLARMESFSNNQNHCDAVESLIEESKFFIEWAAPDAELNAQSELVELQVRLAVWQKDLHEIWSDSVKRSAFAKQTGEWSRRVLEMSGLLKQESVSAV